MIDKNNAVINYLIQCPQIRDNPLFFNFAKEVDNNKQFVTSANDKAMDRPYIDGSVLKRYTFTIIDYRSIIYQALVKQEGYPNENMEEILDVQGIIDWVTEQNKLKNFPNFGDNFLVDSIEALTEMPNTNGVDSSVQPPLVKYSIAIRIQYLDMTEVLFK